ncbi:MAG: hypothetical protein WCK34_16920 [Bacteroidota bacterium]
MSIEDALDQVTNKFIFSECFYRDKNVKSLFCKLNEKILDTEGHNFDQLQPENVEFAFHSGCLNCPIKSFLWQKLDKLCKYIRSGMHLASRVGLGQYMKSNVDVGLIAVSC